MSNWHFIAPPNPTVEKSLGIVRCSVCSRPLTNPESVAKGIGPVCRSHGVAKHMGPKAHPSGSSQQAHAGGRGKGKPKRAGYKPSKEVLATMKVTEKLEQLGTKARARKMRGMDRRQLTDLGGIRGNVGRMASSILDWRAAIASTEYDIGKLEKKLKRMKARHHLTVAQMATSVKLGNEKSRLHGLKQKLADVGR